MFGDRPQRNQQSVFFAMRTIHEELLLRADSPDLREQVGRFLQLEGRGFVSSMANPQERQTARGYFNYWRNEFATRPGDAIDEPPTVVLGPELADLDDADCPYVGLRVFSEEEQQKLFGLEDALNACLDHLYQQRTLVVTGSSSSGKSSLVFAGVLPRLKSDAASGSANWHYVTPFSPGVDPLANLVRVLGEGRIANERWFWRQRRELQESPRYLLYLLEDLFRVPTVLVIDQFEEIFTLCANIELRKAFIRNLVTVLNQPNQRHTIIFLMRDGYDNHIGTLGDEFTVAFLAARLPPLEPPSEQGLRNAIEIPARHVNLHFDAGVTTHLAADLVQRPSPLPLLQYTGIKLWNMRERNRVTQAVYRQIGSAEQLLVNQADRFYETLSLEEKHTMRRILMRLVRFVDDEPAPSTPVERDALLLIGTPAEQRRREMLQRLVDERFVRELPGLVPEEMQVELIHEALVRHWRLLRGWVDEERENLRQRWQLADAAEQWDLGRRDEQALWGEDDPRFVEAWQWQGVSGLEREFLQAIWRKHSLQADAQPIALPAPAAPQPTPAPDIVVPERVRRLPWIAGFVTLALVAFSAVAALWLYFAFGTWQEGNVEASTRIANQDQFFNTEGTRRADQASEHQAVLESTLIPLAGSVAFNATREHALINGQATAAADAAASKAEAAAAERAQLVAENAQATAQAAMPILRDDLNLISQRSILEEEYRTAKQAYDANIRADLSVDQAQAKMDEKRRAMLALHPGELIITVGQPANLNGRLTEWSGFAPMNTFYAPSGVEFEGVQSVWQMQWDQQNLYLAVRVIGAQADQVAVNLQLDRDRVGDYIVGQASLNEDDFHFTLVPPLVSTDDGSGVASYLHQGAGQRLVIQNVVAYSRSTNDGYTLEVAIPWQNIPYANRTAPSPNEVWGVAFNLVQRAGAETAVPMLVKSHVSGHDYHDPSTWGVLVFR